MPGPTTTDRCKPVGVSLPQSVIERVDREAKARRMTRSEFWRMVLEEKLRRLESARR